MKNVMIVDDDEDLLFAYELTLLREAVTVYSANAPNKALEILRETQIDIAILDYMLPQVTGDQLAIQIHMIDPEVKIFFISGYDEVIGAAKEISHNVYGVFKKPIDPNLLTKIVNSDDFLSLVSSSETSPSPNLYSNVVPDPNTVGVQAMISIENEE